MMIAVPSNAPAEGKEFACLVGNGLSIAYNSSLDVAALTEGMFARLSQLAGDAAADALLGFATELGAAGNLRFETLLSPVDQVARALPNLTGAAALVPGYETALVQAAEALTGIHRAGVATVLELISERAYGEGSERLDPVVRKVCRAINDLPTTKPIAVGTLNYDGLIHAGFLDIPNVADLVPGYVPLADYEVANGVWLSGRSLRRAANFGHARIRILNMHGSLSWLWNLTDRDAVKFEFQPLRGISYWEHLRAGTTERVPVVVLTDQKQAAIQDWPFSLAYGTFETSLGFATHWLLAGYGFEDEPLNTVLRDALATQRHFNRLPHVLVVDFGRNAEEWRNHVGGLLGLDPARMWVDTTGLPAAVDGATWAAWKGASP